jgi:hypothetical protein
VTTAPPAPCSAGVRREKGIGEVDLGFGRCVPPLLRFTPDLLRDSVPKVFLSLKRQRDRALEQPRRSAAPTRAAVPRRRPTARPSSRLAT